MYLKCYNLIVEDNFFQVGDQSFQYNYTYQVQQNVILYLVYNMFLMCLFVCPSISFLITHIIFKFCTFTVAKLENIIL